MKEEVIIASVVIFIAFWIGYFIGLKDTKESE
jgi:hypothetical protein